MHFPSALPFCQAALRRGLPSTWILIPHLRSGPRRGLGSARRIALARLAGSSARTALRRRFPTRISFGGRPALIIGEMDGRNAIRSLLRCIVGSTSETWIGSDGQTPPPQVWFDCEPLVERTPLMTVKSVDATRTGSLVPFTSITPLDPILLSLVISITANNIPHMAPNKRHMSIPKTVTNRRSCLVFCFSRCKACIPAIISFASIFPSPLRSNSFNLS